MVFKLSYNNDGSVGKFEDHEVLFARKGGMDTFRNKAKQAEGPKGHCRDDDEERDTPVDKDASRPGRQPPQAARE